MKKSAHEPSSSNIVTHDYINNKFAAGFAECVKQVSHFINQLNDDNSNDEESAKLSTSQLLQHLER